MKNSTNIKNALSLDEPMKHIKWLRKNSPRSLFKFLTGINRNIIPKQVTSISTSVEKMGVVRPVIVAKLSFITGKLEHYIIDGQHLFNACIRLNIDIPYIEIEVKDQKDLVEKIALLNSSSKSWSMQDYVTAWASLIPDYVKLNKYFEVYDIEFTILAAILSNSNAKTGITMGKVIKNGTFKVKNEAKNVELLNYLTDALSIVDRLSRYENRYFCSEYIDYVRNYPNYNHQAFLKQLKAKKERVLLATQGDGKLSDIFSQFGATKKK